MPSLTEPTYKILAIVRSYNGEMGHGSISVAFGSFPRLGSHQTSQVIAGLKQMVKFQDKNHLTSLDLVRLIPLSIDYMRLEKIKNKFNLLEI